MISLASRFSRTKVLVLVIVLLLCTTAGLTAKLLTAEEGGVKSFDSSSQQACSDVTGTDNTAEMRRMVPPARSYSVSAENKVKGPFARFSCEVRADDRIAVKFEVATTPDDWHEWAEYITESELDWSSGRHRVDLYEGGFAGPRAAALYVPCPGLPTEREEALGVTVFTTHDGHHEKDLLRLAKRAAKQATGQLGCEK
ncbi:hypothetical protein [Streptomyces smyrnaeus]|uniref:hypothetical protein n=1 Tax=Streptomyces smyrnaeus TaxID=1387713 RepID=UPI0033E71749